MLHPKLELLDSNLVEQIVFEGIALLENPGIRVHNQEALELLANAGAKVDFQTQVACIPECITRQALKTAPHEFTLFDLKGDPAGGKHTLFLYETLLKSNLGREIPVQVSAVTLMDEGRESGVVGFFRDLRAIRKLEREIADQARILHQDKMMSLGRLAASVVHEINNPLSGILNYIQLMSRILQQGPLSDERRQKFERFVSIVEAETGRCSQIVSGLLSFSRRSPSAFGPVDVEELIRRCVLLSRHKLDLSNIRIESQVQAGLPPLAGDFNQLQQCLINLIFNAIDAMPDGGTLTLNGRLDAQHNTVVIQVKDTGPGIPPEHLASIFEPFFTTKSEGHGLGLGLSTVFGIVERHRGTIAAQNAPEGGALFVITFPVSS